LFSTYSLTFVNFFVLFPLFYEGWHFGFSGYLLGFRIFQTLKYDFQI
jgi:hypothetical protein